MPTKPEYRARRLSEMTDNPRDPHHGTDTGYGYGCRCERCKEAHAEALRAYRRRKQGRSDATASVRQAEDIAGGIRRYQDFIKAGGTPEEWDALHSPEESQALKHLKQAAHARRIRIHGVGEVEI